MRMIGDAYSPADRGAEGGPAQRETDSPKGQKRAAGMTRPGLLVTADGETFRGVSVGADGIAIGEAVFNTSATGYQEILTDPSYAGQVVVMTSPHIGNYGTLADDSQSHRVFGRGLVVRSLTGSVSNWRATAGLPSFLATQRVVALAGVDTRRLTRHLRSRGAMPVAIGADADEKNLAEAAASAPTMAGQDLASQVSTAVAYRFEAEGTERGRIVAVDLGIKRAILRRLAAAGLSTTVVPAGTPVDRVLAANPDGVLLSNGPGDPEPLAGVIETTRRLLGLVPLFGVCLGHQVMGLALGLRTFKLPFGHHGGNHPVRRLADGRVEITAQNHGFAVDLGAEEVEFIPGGPDHALPRLPMRVATPFGEVAPTHQNLNDGTLEGLRCLDLPAFSVQFHPEAAPGPHDSDYLFDHFLHLIEGR